MRKIFALLLVSTIWTLSCQTQKIDLALKLEKGKAYKQNTNSKVTIIQDINGQKINTVVTVKGTMTFLVKSVDQNGYNMDLKYEKLSMAMQLPQGEVEFSSEKKEANDIFSTILGSMKNRPFEVIMSKTGKITDAKNVDELWETVVNQFDELPTLQKEQIKVQLTKAYGEEALKGNIEMVTAIYPDHSVNKGDKWIINTNLESGMSAKMTTDYEFTELTSDYAIIKGKSKIETADKDAYIVSNGMPLKYDLTGEMVSEIKVDRNSGWIIEAEINQEIKGNAYIKENPQMPDGMKIPMSIISEIEITN